MQPYFVKRVIIFLVQMWVEFYRLLKR